MDLEDVKEKLLSIHSAGFEPDWYLLPWFNPAVCKFYLEHAVEVIPTSIRWGNGKPFQCHWNSLEYATEHPGATPWFGFQYLQWASLNGEPIEASWELHSWVVEVDGSIIDSGQYEPAATRYVGVPWSWALHDLIAASGEQPME